MNDGRGISSSDNNNNKINVFEALNDVVVVVIVVGSIINIYKSVG